MPNYCVSWLALTIMASTAAFSADPSNEFRLGGGATYWVALEDIDIENVEEDGFSYLASLQLRNPVAGLGLDLELMPERFGEDTYCGQLYVVLGKGIYMGAGIGLTAVDGDVQDDPFYSLRAGLDIEILTGLHLDLSVQYRFNDTSDLNDEERNIDTDTLYLGAVLRFTL